MSCSWLLAWGKWVKCTSHCKVWVTRNLEVSTRYESLRSVSHWQVCMSHYKIWVIMSHWGVWIIWKYSWVIVRLESLLLMSHWAVWVIEKYTWVVERYESSKDESLPYQAFFSQLVFFDLILLYDSFTIWYFSWYVSWQIT